MTRAPMYTCRCGWRGADVVEHGAFWSCPRCKSPATIAAGVELATALVELHGLEPRWKPSENWRELPAPSEQALRDALALIAVEVYDVVTHAMIDDTVRPEEAHFWERLSADIEVVLDSVVDDAAIVQPGEVVFVAPGGAA